jgi:PilZ domain
LLPSNRRISARKSLRAPANLLLPGGITRELRISDLALDGASFVGTKPVPQGTRVEVRFELPLAGGTTAISAAGKVVYSSYVAVAEFRIGVAFADLDDTSTQALAEFLA